MGCASSNDKGKGKQPAKANTTKDGQSRPGAAGQQQSGDPLKKTDYKPSVVAAPPANSNPTP